jgi:FKBP-type peptidyl-prolyl cis-trans isomerase FkpA
MKKIIVSVFVLVLFFPGTGCLKDNSCTDKSVESEKAAMLSFAAANGITPTEHSSGILYEIVSAGSGQTPNLNSTVSVRYTGKKMDGSVFEAVTGTPVTFVLGGVIPGWQLGLPLIQEAGLIRLIIPSSLAYGCQGKDAIPGNSILYFEIQLVDVQ